MNDHSLNIRIYHIHSVHYSNIEYIRTSNIIFEYSNMANSL